VATPQIEKAITGIAPVDRWLAKFVGLINAWWKIGTDRIQGAFVPIPTDANDGEVLQFDAASGQFEYASASGIGAVTEVTATSPLSSSGGSAPNITLSGVVPVAHGGTGVSSAPADTVFGNPTGSSAAPQFTADPVVSTLLAALVTASSRASVGNPGATTGLLRFYTSTNGTRFTTLSAQDPGPSKNVTFQLPADYPAADGYAMLCDTAGNLSFGILSVAAGGTGVDVAPAGTVFAGPTSGPDAAPSFKTLSSLIPTFSDNETPSGSITGTNGSDGNPTFTIANVPVGEPLVVVTGVTKHLGTDYTRSGATFTFLAPQIPIAGNDWIRIWSRY
jgi:hypothetical protein